MISLATLAATHAGGPWASGYGFLFLLIPLFWIGVFFLLFALVTRRWRRAGWGGADGRAPWANPARRAENTLAERFAQGDIDEKEYRARLEVLRNNDLPAQPNR